MHLKESELWILFLAIPLLLLGLYYCYLGFIEEKPDKQLVDKYNHPIKENERYEVVEKKGYKYQDKSNWRIAKKYDSTGKKIIKKEVSKIRFQGIFFCLTGIILVGYLIYKRRIEKNKILRRK